MLKGKTAPFARVKTQHNNQCHSCAATYNAEATEAYQHAGAYKGMEDETLHPAIQTEKSLEVEMSTSVHSTANLMLVKKAYISPMEIFFFTLRKMHEANTGHRGLSTLP